ncbi:hypothetical protein [Microbacterium sp. No. 7]|uniref:hypothetical protein n=1 Tax=Microbacterium sp. No. 7 TaxID=1714373 RepID=UPI0006D243C7|nr:hypothetical protein [Microbacterium sp. No. 7]ALJ19038.1 hypothetical protein AOA12_03590 [Microbacterium sp. No. 7]
MSELVQQRIATAPSRRTVLKVAAWSAPVVAVSVGAPVAAATTTVPSDLVLEFGDIVEGSTRDITFAVVDFIDRAIRALGPQEPVAPNLVLPPEPVRPPGIPNPINPSPAWQAYFAAVAQWLQDVAAANAAYAEELAVYAQEWAVYQAWNLAVTTFINRLRDLAITTEGLFFASATYPRTLTVRNNGPQPIPAGTTVTVQVITDINLVNAYLPQTGAIQAVQTGGTTMLTYTTTADVPVGGEVFSQPLVYNPVAVTLNITGTVTPSSITAALTPPSQDTDVNDNGDVIASNVGVLLNVATGDVQAILAEWQQFIQQAADFYDLVTTLFPDLDWTNIISGILPIGTP